MRGYQKRVIYIKNTGSEMFEEAYFVVKSDTPRDFGTHECLVDEANRIIRENFENRKRRALIYIKRAALPFLLGALISVLLCVIINSL